MKKINLGISAVAALAIMFTACGKKNTSPEPTADTKFESTIDAAYANSIVTELEDIAAYLGDENTNSSKLFANAGSSGSVTYTNVPGAYYAIGYNGTVSCIDGKTRSGEIKIDYTTAPSNSKAYRKPGYKATVTLTNYMVNGVKIRVNGASSVNTFTIFNSTPTAGYNARQTPLTWEITGDFTLSNATDSMTWKGKLNKTLANSTNSLILAGNNFTTSPITWSKNTFTASPGALVVYSGTIEGKVNKLTEAYKLEMSTDPLMMMTRDYNCSPDKIVLQSAPTLSVMSINSEWHPYIAGSATITVDTEKEPRIVDFSNGAGMGCDNSVFITVKSTTYPVDLKK
ncbi:MAG: hypothetical protein LCH32_10975 [Bacteroidetes bacterium]|nr:hypothetical protein [Bacteroidota bacterium]